MRLGENVEEYAERRAATQDDIWIKGFKKGETRVRILQPTKPVKDPSGQIVEQGFTTYREHYKKEAGGGFPCGEDFGLFCPAESKHGLESDVKVQSRPRRYAFNALDEKGRLNLYKCGVKLFTTMQSHENRRGSITNADYTVIRSGDTMDSTVYEFERGDTYPLEGDMPELYDIPKINGDHYLAALKYYGVDEQGRTLDDMPPVEDETEPPLDDTDEAQTVPEPAAEAKGQFSAPKGPSDSFDVTKDAQDFTTLSTPQVRAWLDERGVEYPAAEPRPRLIKRATEWTPF